MSACLISVAAGAFLGGAPSALAGSYTVVACDAAGAEHGFANNSWGEWKNAGSTYSACPTNGDRMRGITTRMVGSRYPSDAFAVQGFEAPPDTTISNVRWSGRWARDNCDWRTALEAWPSREILTGLPDHRNCPLESADHFNFVETFRPPPGTTGLAQVVQCRASSCSPGATFHTRYAEVTVLDQALPNFDAIRGQLASGAWSRGRQTVYLRGLDNVGLWALGVAVGEEGSNQTFQCNRTHPRHCPTNPAEANLDILTTGLPDGVHVMQVGAADAGGNYAFLNKTVRVDNTAPDPLRPAIVGGGGWRREPAYDVRWQNPHQAHAPIARARWELCTPTGTCREGSQEGNAEELKRLSVQGPGEHTLRIWLQDAAGNERKPPDYDAIRLRHDPIAPGLAFEPGDPADPLRVGVEVRDEHSGLAAGEVEMRRVGTSTWHSLPTGVQGSRLTAYVDDERFRNGSYEFRARAVDGAGNEASTGRRLDGTAATLRLPVRFGTNLRVGARKTRIRRRVVRRNGRRRVVRRRIVSLVPRTKATLGRRVNLHGRLSNVDGQPIEDATLDVFERTGEGDYVPLGSARSDRVGRFTYIAKASRNRTLRFYYRGSRRIRSATREVHIAVPALSSIRVNRSSVLNGQAVRFRGRVATQPLPPTGKLIEMQAFFRSRWRTFSTVRSDARGRWRFPYRFGGTVGRIVYRFRVRLPQEGGYPFATGTSRVVRVAVRGP